MSVAVVPDRLQAELKARGSRLRPPEVVMRPEMLGAARLTRYSFSRTMLRRAVAGGWTACRAGQDLDAEARGESVYTVEADGHRFSFVAFTTTIDESAHTDRVIAERWEVAGVLVEGEVTEELMATLRVQVPEQERGRLDPRVLCLTRGNRSVRFFGYLVDALAAGQQPDPDLVGDAGYILRSTAFYANGKFGMRSFAGYPTDHPLGPPYRAQFVAAWLFRELGYDMVEHCARIKGGETSVSFDEEWRRFFGLGNATGLGLVPYAFKHPRVLDAWVGVREVALADQRDLPGDPTSMERLTAWIARARRHFSTGGDEDCHPFLNARSLVPVLDRIASAWEDASTSDLPFDALYRWAEVDGPETAEMVVSLLLELHEADDALVDEMFVVEERAAADPAMTVGEARRLLDERFDWLADLGLDGIEADTFWWVVSDNTEEPRRALRSLLAPEHRDVAIDTALRLWRLRADMVAEDSDTPIHRFLAERPEHRLAVERLHASDRRYGEPRDNACAAGYLPLQIQRFQLAMYGMDNYKPKSTDWLRVTLFQGAPRLDDLGPDVTDDWVLPPRPGSPA
ncbi:MAG: hypothetical protein VX905_05975 [Actinomycetota bacterium]|nr:hypothetical protein [Actinomycetota bacterium]